MAGAARPLDISVRDGLLHEKKCGLGGVYGR